MHKLEKRQNLQHYTISAEANLFRATSNYRSACMGRSKAEFISKLNIVLEEANELTAIFVTTLKTTKRNIKN